MFPKFKTLDEVPEMFRSLYKLNSDTGEFEADAVMGGEVSALRRSKADILAEKKRLQDELDGLDMDDVRAYKASGGRITKDAQARLDAAAAKEKELLAKISALETSGHKSLKQTAIVGALADMKASRVLLEPVVSGMVDVETNERGEAVVIVRDAAGNVRYTDGQGTRMTPKDLLVELSAKPEYKPAFNVEVGSGGGTPPGGGGGGTPQGKPYQVRVSDPGLKTGKYIDDIASGKAVIVE